MDNKKSYGKENDLNLKTVIALNRSFQSVRKRELKTIKKGGLTLAQFGVLEVLYHKGDLRICDIIEKTLSTGGNMTVVIDNLLKDGFVVRHPDPNDGRASLIGISNKGIGIIEEIFPEHVENIGAILSPLTSEEKQLLIDLLKKVSSGVE